MDSMQNFLETSTVHGLTHISAARKYVRLFWIIVVIAGFIGAGVLIYQSFEDWIDNPITTTIETLPMTEITFPKVTVCPPKHTYTDLNYDLRMAENMTLDNETRTELTNHAFEMLYDHLFSEIMKNMSIFKDNDRYYNWYHGHTQIKLIQHTSKSSEPGINYEVLTSALNGTVSTQHFGEKFNSSKVDMAFYYQIKVYVPQSVRYNENISMHFEIEKVSIEGQVGRWASGQDNLKLSGLHANVGAEIQNMNKTYKPPGFHQTVTLARKVTAKDLKRENLYLMPGFKLTWYYSGGQVEPEAAYTNQKSHMNPHFSR